MTTRVIAPIQIWPFYEAPKYLQLMSENGGDEDWIAVLQPGFEQPWFLEEGGRFGCCSVDKYTLDDGSTLLIASHS